MVLSLCCFVSQSLLEDLDSCGRSLSDLDAAVQEFSRRNPLLAKQLSDAINKMSEMHHHTSRLADCRNNWLKKVCFSSHLDLMLLLAQMTILPDNVEQPQRKVR